MKTLNRLMIVLLFPLMGLAACAPKEEAYVPGEPETQGCYHVYFPSQTNVTSGEMLITPDMDKFVDLTVCRKVTDGAITVPYTLYSNVDGDVFDQGVLSFAAGEAETTLRVGLSRAPTYQSVTVTVSLDDPQYAAIYESEAQSLSFSFILVDLLNLGRFTFTQHLWASLRYELSSPVTVQADILYYELDGVRYCITGNEETSTGAPGFWGFGDVDEFAGNHFYFTWFVNEVDGLGHQPVEIPIQRIGREDWSEWGYGFCYYNVYDSYHFWQDWYKYSNYGSFVSFARKYATTNPVGYYDGEGGFHFPIYAYILPEFTMYDDKGYPYYTQVPEDLVGYLNQ